MPNPRLFHDKPQRIRMATADAEWLEEEGTRRGCARAVILRQLIADARDCSSLPPSPCAQILAAVRREGLSFRDYVSELLRAEAQRSMAVGRAEGEPALERRRTAPSRS